MAQRGAVVLAGHGLAIEVLIHDVEQGLPRLRVVEGRMQVVHAQVGLIARHVARLHGDVLVGAQLRHHVEGEAFDDVDLARLQRALDDADTPVKRIGVEYRQTVIEGLYAAGCDVGNISHYEYAGGLAPALATGRVAGRNAGACDSGYSCAYQYNLSWASATTPMAPAGRSASTRSWANRMNVSDAIWAGLTIAALPAARISQWPPLKTVSKPLYPSIIRFTFNAKERHSWPIFAPIF